MDVFPSLFDYLRIPLKESWDLDGISRLKFADPPASPRELCELSRTHPAIALSGGYVFNAPDSENMASNRDRAVDQCLAEATDFGRFHYHSWSPCIESVENDAILGMCDDTCAADLTAFALETGF